MYLEFCRLGWLAGLVGWEGLPGHANWLYDPKPCPNTSDVYRPGWLADLAGWEGVACQNANRFLDPKPCPYIWFFTVGWLAGLAEWKGLAGHNANWL